MLTFAPRTPIRLGSDRYTMVSVETVDGMRMWSLRRKRDAELVRRTQAELEKAYEEGQLVSDRDGDLPEVTRDVRRRRNTLNPDDLSEGERTRFDLVKLYLRTLEEKLVPGTENTRIREGEHAGKTNLEVVLEGLVREHGLPASRATIYRWRRDYREGDPRKAQIGDFAARGNRKQMHPIVARILHDTLLERLLQAQADGADRTLTRQSDLRAEVEKRVKEVQLAPGDKALVPPSKSTVQEHWSKLPAFERDVAKHGRVRAQNMYRGPKGGYEVKHALDVVEYDETHMPFFFFDEATNIPLGRGWLSWFADRYSQNPLGIHVGFEAIGDLTICSALRHACSTKAWIAEHYPNIENRFEAGGIPRMMVFDNSLSNWGGTVRSLSASLDNDYKFTPSRSPWLKSTIEGMHDMLNRSLLSSLPGFILSKQIDRVDYDPAKMGCIGLRTFLAIFFKWLLDVYQVSPHGVLRDTPLNRWRASTAEIPPGYPDRSADIEVLFGVLREGNVDNRLDHNGVVFENIRYWSEELGAMRLRNGSVQKVKIKVNPSNLGSIKVLDRNANGWITAQAREFAYAAGLSLHVHKLQQKFARQRLGGIDDFRLHQAKIELGQMIKDAHMVTDSLRSNVQLARAFGIGTQHILDCVDAAGRLGPLTGPFQGQPLNPYTAVAPLTGQLHQPPVPPPLVLPDGAPLIPRVAAEPLRARTAAPEPVPPLAPVKSPAAAGDGGQPVMSPFSALPVFKADKSLSSDNRKST